MTKYFVLDTNVLIHNPESIHSFADNTVIIPITVVEELDRFKNNSDKRGMHARHALRSIDKQVRKGALKEGAKMKNGGKLIISLDDDNKKIPYLDPLLNDNKILAAAYELKNNNETVFFISKDVNARIKAEALGIPARDYEKQKVEYDSLYKGWKEVHLSESDVNKIIQKEVFELKGFTFLKNQFALIKSQDDNRKSILCRFNYETKMMDKIPFSSEAMGIRPMNLEQNFAMNLLLDNNIKLVTLLGQAGTGKTLLAIAAGLKNTLGKNALYKKVLVARPILPMGKDIGYLPGDKDEKLGFWMQPIFDNLEYIFMGSSKDDEQKEKKGEEKMKKLLQSNIIKIEALTYIRGRSIPDQFLIVDEAQNLTPHEIKTIISRAGEGTKIVLTGDPEQIDNPYLDANSNGLSYAVENLKDNDIVGHIFLSKSERSSLATLAARNL